MTATIDQRGLDFMISGIRNALIATGGDISELTKDESRLLAMQLMNLSKPKDRKKTAEKIGQSVSAKFLGLSETKYASQKSGGMWWRHWDEDYLYGVAPDRDMRHASVGDLADIYFGSKANRDGAKVLPFVHPRKKQMVKLYQKIVTGPAAVKRLTAYAQKAIGKLAGSWFATAKKIDPSSTAPQWISRHEQTRKSITDLTGLANPEHPSVTFGSKAGGAATKKGLSLLQVAMNIREKKLTYRLQLILSGYAQDVRNNIAVNRKAKKIKGVP